MTSRAGRLIVLEGPEGAGKSTQLRRLAAWLDERGVDVAVVREPGGTPLGDAVRGLLLDGAVEVSERAEALLFMASRAQAVDRVLEPALAAGRFVIVDRFFLSTYAYQIAGRGLPEAEVRTANRLATGGLVPDVTLLLSIAPEVGMQRASRRGDPDRMERAGADFHRRVARAFAEYASPAWQREHAECGPIVAIDATGDEGAVFARLLEALARRWPESFAAATSAG